MKQSTKYLKILVNLLVALVTVVWLVDFDGCQSIGTLVGKKTENYKKA